MEVLQLMHGSTTLILTRSREYICVRNLDFFHLVGNDLRYTRLKIDQVDAILFAEQPMINIVIMAEQHC